MGFPDANRQRRLRKQNGCHPHRLRANYGKRNFGVDGAPAFLQTIGGEHKTYVPLTLLAQGLGLDVQYSAKMKTVFVNE
ncbi:hypothetical protein HMSSN036_83690 [Paenibacillus macerans]|nr:hypothetical protein HMSSN036_83690 [Paenibacillus macerans]